ncbi:protein of unknown function [Cyanobium sp. NIES-981]|nr:protein of unknown function [Cyanobium sp. NIES-981]
MDRTVQPPCGRLEARSDDGCRSGGRGTQLSPRPAACGARAAADSHGSGQPVPGHRLPGSAQWEEDRLQDVRQGLLLGQRRGREILLHPKAGTGARRQPQGTDQPSAASVGSGLLDRGLLQLRTPSFNDRLSMSDRLQAAVHRRSYTHPCVPLIAVHEIEGTPHPLSLTNLLRQSTHRAAIVDENVFGKRTLASRKETACRLTALHGLDPTKPLFRMLRRFGDADPTSRPQLALLSQLACAGSWAWDLPPAGAETSTSQEEP